MTAKIVMCVAFVLLVGCRGAAPAARPIPRRPVMATAPERQPRPGELPRECVAAAELSLAGLRLHAPASTLAVLGRPRSEREYQDQDDGGPHAVRVLDFDSLRVQVVRSAIDGMETRSPRLATPSGVRPTLPRPAVMRLLRSDTSNTADTVTFRTCLTDSLPGSMTLIFDRSARLRAMHLLVSRP